MQYDEEYYVFELKNEASEVNFQLTVMNGDLKAYASR